MKKILFLLVLSIVLMAAVSSDSLYTIVTSKENALVNKKYTTFIMVDDATNMALGKTPVKFDISKDMPLNYFTITLPENAAITQRVFTIHNIITENNPDEYDWVLEDNPDENQVFYSRRKFVIQAKSMQWIMVVRGERVLIKNIRTGSFIKIEPNGNLTAIQDEASASKWKLIHVY